MELPKINGKLKVYIGAGVFVLGVAFAAGRGWQKSESVGIELQEHKSDTKEGYKRLSSVEQNQAVMNAELSQIKEILKEIREELREKNRRR